MRELKDTISRDLLPYVRKPGQYVGLEPNARRKDPRAADVSVALAFPDTYAIGISHLGSQVLYQAVNDLPHAACDRTYCPQRDAEERMRDLGIPLFAWESRLAVGDFDVLGFSLPYELCVTNVLTMLDLAGVPLRVERRGEEDPIVIAGDALADSPEPMAPFIDLFLPGDGEATLPDLLDLVGRARGDRLAREELLLEAARTLPGVYAPRLYAPRYDSRGRFTGLEPHRDGLPEAIERARVGRLDNSPPVDEPLVPVAEAIHDRPAIEVMRGCPNACRFCQAGATRLPVRIRTPERVRTAARRAVESTGSREVSLLSLSTSDYPRLDELIDSLAAELTPHHVSISLPSLRVDAQLRHLPKLTSGVRKGGLTIAAEAGSERLRRAIGKRITEEDMLAGVQAAYQAGWRKVKVYFIAGLPGETDEDLDAIYHLCRRLSDRRRDVDGQPGAISASVSWFVPKPHTPMQWCPMRKPDYFFTVRRRLRELSRRSPVTFRFHWIERSFLEGVIARGDRRVGDAIEAAWRRGARLDAWDEHFEMTRWQEAFEETGTDPDAIACRQLDLDEPLPWSHIRTPRSEAYLRSEYEKMLRDLDAGAVAGSSPE